MFNLKTNQIIYVKGNKLTLYNKINNIWTKDIETDCVYGKNGYSSNRHEGDYTTPIGSYPLLFAFGIQDNPGAKMEYRKITENSYYSDDYSRPDEYNRWIESEEKIQGEHLIEYPKQYKYGMVIGFNINPVIIGKGSSIFLHCKGDKGYTAGCIAVDESVMLYLLKNIGIGAYIVIEA